MEHLTDDPPQLLNNISLACQAAGTTVNYAHVPYDPLTEQPSDLPPALSLLGDLPALLNTLSNLLELGEVDFVTALLADEVRVDSKDNVVRLTFPHFSIGKDNTECE